MGYYEFPHTRNYDQDLGFLIKKYNKLNKDYNTLINIYEIVKNNIKNITIEELEKWLDDGTIENILLSSSKVVLKIDTTIEMLKQNFIDGTLIKTIGYNSVDDFKGAFFYVSKTPINKKYYIKKDNLYFILINDEISTNQCGIFPSENNTTELNNFFNCDYITHYIDSGTYMIDGKNSNDYHYWAQTGVFIPGNRHIIFKKNAIFQLISCDTFSSSIIQLQQSNNVKIENPYLIGDRETHTLSTPTSTDELGIGILIRNSKNVTINNASIYNTHGDGIYIGSAFETNETLVGQCKNIYIYNSYLENCYRNGISLCYCNNAIVENVLFNNIKGVKPECCIDIESESYDVTKYLDNRNIKVRNCRSNNTTAFIEIYDSFDCVIENSYCEKNKGYIYEHLNKLNNKSLSNKIINCYANTISIVADKSKIINSEMNYCGLGDNKENAGTHEIINSFIEHWIDCFYSYKCKIRNCCVGGDYEYQPTIRNLGNTDNLYIEDSTIKDAIKNNITLRNNNGNIYIHNSKIEGNAYLTSCDIFINNCKFLSNGKNSISTNNTANILNVNNSIFTNTNNSINFINTAYKKIYIQNNIATNTITNFITVSEGQENEICIINNNILLNSLLNLINRSNNANCINF